MEQKNGAETEIGVAVINYSPEGKVLSAGFEPTLKMSFTPELLDQLSGAKSDTAETVRVDSEIIMAAWFSKMNEIELADREEYHIVSTVEECVKYPDGRIKTCKVKFSFKKIGTN